MKTSFSRAAATAWTTTALAGVLLASGACKQGVIVPRDPGPPKPNTIGPITHVLPNQCAGLHEDWQPTTGSTFAAARPALRAPAAPAPDSMGNCPLSACGLNGSWLGSGVQFRTLHTTAGALNAQGLRVRDFKLGNEVMRLEVVGQQLMGVRRDTSDAVKGTRLRGAELALEHVDAAGSVDASYTLKIADVREVPFWARCANKESCNDAPPMASVYTITVTASDGCEVKLCRPGLGDDYRGGIGGTAVIFRGDYYEEGSHVVRTTPVNTYDQDVFNIACIGTAISKLHLLRHTTAADPGQQPNPEQRQGLLRLLTADYCGTGGSFTEDGVPIGLGFEGSRWVPTSASGYVVGAESALEARWSQDGALCLNAPRLPTVERARIDAACRLVGKPVPPACPAADAADPLGGASSWSRPR